ncbi:MAG: hypothetical protein M0T83_01525 [Nitrospiraceae bacterium]|nr:hypothetical protein [Nitrospiraceae bacterium]
MRPFIYPASTGNRLWLPGLEETLAHSRLFNSTISRAWGSIGVWESRFERSVIVGFASLSVRLPGLVVRGSVTASSFASRTRIPRVDQERTEIGVSPFLDSREYLLFPPLEC